MTELQIAEDILPLGQFKANASALLKGMNSTHRPIVITQNGKPTAVVVSPAKYDRLNEQSRFIAAVRQGLEDEQAGRLIDDEAIDDILQSASHS